MFLASCLVRLATAAPLAESYDVIYSPIPSDGRAFAYSLAPVGDVNGDGYGDFAVGHIGPVGSASSAFLYFGTPNGLSAALELVNPNPMPDDLYSQVGGGGDLNGDGYDDVVVGAYTERFDPGTNELIEAGAAYVFYGSANSISAPQRIIAPDAAAEDLSPLFGASVNIPGDLDGDGYDDLVVGASRADGLLPDVGAVYVFPGRAGGIRGDNVTKHQDDLTVHGHYGERSEGGDLDGDGAVDLIVSAPSSGRYFVYPSLWDGTEIVSTAGELLLGSGVGDVDGDGADEVVSLRWNLTTSVFTLDTFGSFVGTTYLTTSLAIPAEGLRMDVVGDLDGDGYDEVVVGQEAATVDLDGTPLTLAGTVAVYYGGPDGIEDYTRVEVPPPREIAVERLFFGRRVSRGGDIDRDGFADFVVAGNLDQAVVYFGGCDDLDSDGFCGRDCDDADPSAHPGASSESATACMRDADGDGWGDAAAVFPIAAGTDCDDASPDISPDAVEIVGDGIDSDCDGTELCFADADRDGYGDAVATVVSADPDCTDPGEIALTGPRNDCDDGDPSVHPGAYEGIGDGVDSDCDGTERCLLDEDEDGYVGRSGDDVASPDLACDGPGEAAARAPTGDCDDTDGAVHPGAVEGVGDGVDSDCDGAELCFADADGDGYPGPDSASSTALDCSGAGVLPAGAADADCDDADGAIYPGALDTPGDGIDSDCDGADAAADPGAPDTGAKDEDGSGCGCDAGATGSWVGALLAGGLVLRRRQRTNRLATATPASVRLDPTSTF